MTKIRWLHNKHRRIYPVRKLTVLAVFCSLGLIMYNERPSWEWLFNIYFYLAWSVSTAITILVLFLVLSATCYLDYYHPWIKDYNKRISYQIITGVLLPIGLVFLLIAVYFWGFQINIFKTIWFREYMFQIAALLIIINLVFCFIWHRDRNSRVEQYKVWKRQLKEETTVFGKDLACIMSTHRHSYVIRLDGTYNLSPVNIERCIDLLPPPNYFWINSSYIISLHVIENVYIENTKQVYIVMPRVVELTVLTILEAMGQLKGNKHTVRFKTYNGENRLCLKISQSKFADFTNVWGDFNAYVS